MLSQYLNKKTLLFIAVLQIIIILFLIFNIFYASNIMKNEENIESNIDNDISKKENNTTHFKDGDEDNNISKDNFAKNIKANNEAVRKYMFLKTLFDYNNSQEYKDNILNFFSDEKYLYVFLNEGSIENIKEYHSKRQDIYINTDKNILYGFFDHDFIYIPLEKHINNKYRVKRPGIIWAPIVH